MPPFSDHRGVIETSAKTKAKQERCQSCQHYFEEEEPRVYFPTSGRDANRYHILCAPQNTHYQVETAYQMEGFGQLSTADQLQVAFDWEGANATFHSEDSDSDPDDPGILPRVRRTTRTHHFRKTKWYTLKQREKLAKLQSKPSTALFAFHKDNLKEDSIDLSASSQAFRALSPEKQLKYRAQVRKERASFKQSERRIRSLVRVKELSSASPVYSIPDYLQTVWQEFEANEMRTFTNQLRDTSSTH